MARTMRMVRRTCCWWVPSRSEVPSIAPMRMAAGSALLSRRRTWLRGPRRYCGMQVSRTGDKVGSGRVHTTSERSASAQGGQAG